jgi:hypothetical protein
MSYNYNLTRESRDEYLSKTSFFLLFLQKLFYKRILMAQN